GDEIEKVLEWEVRVQSSDDVEFSDRFAVPGSGGLKRLFQCHGVSARGVFLSSKSTETASGHTDIGGIDMPVYVEISLIAMQAFADAICQPPDGQDVRAAV